MDNGEVVRARPQDNIAILQIDERNNIHGFVTVGGIGKKEEFQYLEVSRDLIDNKNMRHLPPGTLKFTNGKIVFPRFRKMKLGSRKYLGKFKHWFKHSKMHDVIDIIGSLLLPHVFVSITSAVISSFIALYVLSIASKSEDIVSLSSFLAAFIPCLTIFVTLIGIYVTLREARLGSERQRKESVKPHISLSNFDLTSVKPENKAVYNSMSMKSVSIPRDEERDGSSYVQVSPILVENVGLGVARNISFIYLNKDKEIHSFGFSIKSMKPDSWIDIEISVPTDYKEHQFVLYSMCENIYGDTVFHAHHFLPMVEGKTARHLRDRQIKEGSREFKDIIRSSGFWHT